MLASSICTPFPCDRLSHSYKEVMGSSRLKWYSFGNAVLFTIVAAMLFEFMYINLLIRGGLLARVDWLGIGLFLFVSLLSFSAAESSAWILFPCWWSRLNPSYGINFCVLSVHWSCLIALLPFMHAGEQRACRGWRDRFQAASQGDGDRIGRATILTSLC